MSLQPARQTPLPCGLSRASAAVLAEPRRSAPDRPAQARSSNDNEGRTDPADRPSTSGTRLTASALQRLDHLNLLHHRRSDPRGTTSYPDP